MRHLLFSLCTIFLFCSCGNKEYEYANLELEFYEDLIEEYEDAENLDSLNAIYNRVQSKQKQIATEQKASYNELVKDMELLDENAYLIHLQLLSAESHAQWMYFKRTKDFEKEKKKGKEK